MIFSIHLRRKSTLAYAYRKIFRYGARHKNKHVSVAHFILIFAICKLYKLHTYCQSAKKCRIICDFENCRTFSVWLLKTQPIRDTISLNFLNGLGFKQLWTWMRNGLEEKIYLLKLSVSFIMRGGGRNFGNYLYFFDFKRWKFQSCNLKHQSLVLRRMLSTKCINH